MSLLKRGLLRRFDVGIAFVMPVFDFVLAYLALATALGTSERFLEGVPERYWIVIFFASILAPAWFARVGLYQPWRGQPLWSELRGVAMAWCGLAIVMALVALATKTGGAYSRMWLMHSFLLGLFFLGVFRIVLRLLINHFRARGFNARFVVLIGSEKRCKEALRTIKAAAWSGLTVSKKIVFKNGIDETTRWTQELRGELESNLVDQIWLAFDLSQSDVIDQVQKVIAPYPVRLVWVPDLLGVQLINQSVSEVAGMPVVTLQGAPLSGWKRLIKGLEDRVLAAAILLLMAVPMLLIAVAVKSGSKGPLIFAQKRNGVSGKPIVVYKFRTMAEHKESGVIASATANDSRVTAIGRFLRRTSLDELPQFFNVLLGNMSIVGPRPHSITQEEQFTGYYHLYPMRHKIKPGITGWAQINGLRGEITSPDKLRKRVEHDIYYLNNWSLWLDIRIILLTAFKGWTSPNAY